MEPVIVTLDDVTWLVGHEAAVRSLGFVEADEPVPWIVSAFNLEIVARTLEFPAQLMLYLDRRKTHIPSPSGDELNFWMVHLLRSLDLPTDGKIILQGDWTKEIDRHFMFGYGQLPKMPLSGRARRAVAALDRNRQPGHLEETARLIADDQARRPPEPTLVIERNDGMRVYTFANPG